MTSAAQSAGREAHHVADSKPVQVGARVGLVSYGVTHLLIAWLALQVAFGGGDDKASQAGAFQQLSESGLGRVLLWVLVVGFVATALWRLGQAIWGFSYEEDKKDRWRKRASSGFKVVVFGALAVIAVRTAVGGGGGGNGGAKATAGVLGLPGGQWIVGAAGLGIVGAGVWKAYAGWTERFTSDMDLPSDHKARQAAVKTGQVGFIAKGVATALVGVLVVVAAVRFRPDEANGLDSALRSLARQPFGPWLLALVALGLAAYGIFCFFDARYHRV